MDLDNYVPCDLGEITTEGAYCGNWELYDSVDIYAERDGKGMKIGYTKPNIPVCVEMSNDEWIRLYFENEKSPDNYKLIKVEDFINNSNYSKTDIESEVKTDEAEETSSNDIETMWIYPSDYNSGNDKDVSGLTWTECNIDFTNKDVLQLYTDTGKNFGWLHENITVTFTEENEEWYRFKNMESQIDSEYLLVAKSSVKSQEKQSEYAEQDRLYEEAMALLDENKTYTIEEFTTLMKDAAEVIGVEFSSDVAKDNAPSARTINLNGKKLKETYDELLWVMIAGPTGSEKMDIYFGLKEQNPDTTEDFEIFIFTRSHQE